MNPVRTRSGLLAASALWALVPGTALAQSAQVYGQLRLTVNRVDTGATHRLELRDNASRLGFRGTEAMGGGLAAVYGLEFGLGADTGEMADPAATFRNSYVGLRGPFGVFALGRLDSANPTGSPLYSQVTSLLRFAPNDAGATAIGTSMLNARNRTSNSLGYQSPSFGGFDLRLRTYLRGSGTAVQPEDSARSLDLGLNYQAPALRLALGLARDTRRGGLATNELDWKWQAGARVDLGPVSLGLLAGQDRYAAAASARRTVDYAIAGAAWVQGPSTWVLNLMQREVQASPTGVRRRVQASWQVALSRRTEWQLFVDRDGVDSSRSGVRVRAVGTGLRHDF